jgi:transposase-like protein
MKAQDEQSIRAKVQLVQQWRDSGQSKSDWAQANGIEAKQLMGWIANASRWQARLQGQPIARRNYPARSKPSLPHSRLRQEQAKVPPTARFAPVYLQTPLASQPGGAHVRIEHAASGLVLHWPTHDKDCTAQIAQLAQALRT